MDNLFITPEVLNTVLVPVVSTIVDIETRSKKMRLQRTSNFNDLMFPVRMEEWTETECNPDQQFSVFVNPRGFDIKVCTCSDVYELVQNQDVFGVARQILLDSGIVFSESYEIINDARFYGTFIIEGHDFELQDGDVIKPIFKLNHSYNGQTKYSMSFGYFRMICSNGLVIPLDEKSEYNLNLKGKHTKKINKSLESLFEKITYFVENTDVYAENFKMLANRIVFDVSGRIEEILKATGIASIDNKVFNTLNWILNVIEFEADQLSLGIVTDWLIYNGINRYLYSENRNGEVPETKQNLDASVLNYIIKTCISRTPETNILENE